jgi:hypothetical protein
VREQELVLELEQVLELQVLELQVLELVLEELELELQVQEQELCGTEPGDGTETQQAK